MVIRLWLYGYTVMVNQYGYGYMVMVMIQYLLDGDYLIFLDGDNSIFVGWG